MSRIPLDPPRTLVYRARRVVLPPRASAPSPTRCRGDGAQPAGADDRRRASRSRWPSGSALDPTLKALAEMAAAVQIGCSWCVDFGYWVSDRARASTRPSCATCPRWRDSDVFTDLERDVLAYAEAVTATPPTVTDEMVAGLRRELGRRRAGRADHDGRRGEHPVAVQQRPRADQPGLQGPLRDPADAVRGRAARRDRRRPCATRSTGTGGCCSPSPTRCSAASPTPRTSSRTPGCAGRRPTGATSPTRAPTWCGSPPGWRSTGCGSARARRESYVGPWLPEPLLTGAVPVASGTPPDPERRRRARRAGVAGRAGRPGDALPGRAGGLRPARGVRDAGRRRSPRRWTARRPPSGSWRTAPGSTCRRGVRGSTPTAGRSGEVTERFLAAAVGGDVESLLAALAPGVVLVARRRRQGQGRAAADRGRGQGGPVPRRASAPQGTDLPGLRIELDRGQRRARRSSRGPTSGPFMALQLVLVDGLVEQVLVRGQPRQARRPRRCRRERPLGSAGDLALRTADRTRRARRARRSASSPTPTTSTSAAPAPWRPGPPPAPRSPTASSPTATPAVSTTPRATRWARSARPSSGPRRRRSGVDRRPLPRLPRRAAGAHPRPAPRHQPGDPPGAAAAGAHQLARAVLGPDRRQPPRPHDRRASRRCARSTPTPATRSPSPSCSADEGLEAWTVSEVWLGRQPARRPRRRRHRRRRPRSSRR